MPVIPFVFTRRAKVLKYVNAVIKRTIIKSP